MKNPVEHSMHTCDVLEQLEPRPLEILITANGCTDGTIEFVSSALLGTGLIMVSKGGARSLRGSDDVRHCWQWTPDG